VKTAHKATIKLVT